MKNPWYRSVLLYSGFALLMLSPLAVSAQDDLDVTMRMVTDDEGLTDSVVREIELSTPIGLENGSGLKNGDVGDRGREFGQEVAEQAREAARLRKEARESGRPEKPDKPGKPNNPGKPDKTGKPD